MYFVPAAGTAIVPDDISDPEPAVAAAGDGGSEPLNKNEQSADMMGQLSEGAAAALAPLTQNVDVSHHLAVLTQVYRGKLLLSMTCRVRMSTLNHCMRRTPSHDRPPPPPSGLMSPPRGLAVWRWSGGGGTWGVAVDQRPTFGGIEREGACHSRFITSARPTVPYDPDPRHTARTMPSSPGPSHARTCGSRRGGCCQRRVRVRERARARARGLTSGRASLARGLGWRTVRIAVGRHVLPPPLLAAARSPLQL